MANAAGFDLDENFIGPGRRTWNFYDLEWLFVFADDGCFQQCLLV
jgi:hypothetical protein